MQTSWNSPILIIIHKLILGDLNEISKTDQTTSASIGNSIRYNNCNRFLYDNHLIDLGYVGNLYTWHNRRGKQAANVVRLDGALANHLCLNMYHNSFLENLASFGSDHAAILLDTLAFGKHK